jgi:hypothetical protein
MIIAASRDQSFPIDGVKQVFEYGRRLYASDRIAFFEDKVEGHGYQIRKREAAYGWFLRWLTGRGNGEAFKEPAVHTADVDDPEYRCFKEKQGAGPGMAAYARALAARPRHAEPQKVNEVLGLTPLPRSAAQPRNSHPGCTLITMADNGADAFPENALPESGWKITPARVRGLNGDVLPQPGWTAAVSLLLGENPVARQAEDLEQALSAAGACVAVYAHGHNASLAATYAAARNPQRAAWILRGGFITYRHFIDRPVQAAKSFDLKIDDKDRTTSFDREIPFAYVPFGALRNFDLPDLLAPARAVLLLNPIDGDWKPLTKADATRWLPPNATLVLESDPAKALGMHLESWRTKRTMK